jgi:hypothetical protein
MNDELALRVLSEHYVLSVGLTYLTPNRCVCGAETFPADGTEDTTKRRARAFAAHQVEMLAEARKDA